jgi:hypothetical protein
MAAAALPRAKIESASAKPLVRGGEGCSFRRGNVASLEIYNNGIDRGLCGDRCPADAYAPPDNLFARLKYPR